MEGKIFWTTVLEHYAQGAYKYLRGRLIWYGIHHIGQIWEEIVSTEFPTFGTWFDKFTRGSKLRMGVIRKQVFGATIIIVK